MNTPTITEEAYDAFADVLEEAIDARVEYETSHQDAGGAYSNLPREGGWDYSNGDDRLKAFLDAHDIRLAPSEFESLVESILDDCEIRPVHMFHSPADHEFTVDSYAVGEVEDQYCLPDLARLLGTDEDTAKAFAEMAMEDRRFCLRPNGDGGVLSYTSTDAFWQFYVDVDWVRERVGWMREDSLVEARSWLFDAFGDREGDISSLSDNEVIAAVERYYDGGWAGFLHII